jgi:hypothetical protein
VHFFLPQCPSANTESFPRHGEHLEDRIKYRLKQGCLARDMPYDVPDSLHQEFVQMISYFLSKAARGADMQ